MADNSLQERIQANWKQLSGSVRQEWGKLTHNDVEQIRGEFEVLAGKIQERYSLTKAEARKQIEQWVDRMRPHQPKHPDGGTQAN